MSDPEYSIIAPIYNESATLPELYRRVSETMGTLDEPWELIFVDDGSTDGSTELIKDYAQKDSHIRPVIFARNFGHQIAVTAGLDYSRGKAVIIIDSDLQDPPEVIPDLIQKWREGYEVVYAYRTEREGESWFKLTTASLFYRMIYKITDVDIPLDTGDFRLLDRKVVNVINQMRERHRFLRGMSVWVGFRQTGVPYRRAARYAGDEFVVLMPCGSEIGHKRADDLLQKFRTEAFMFDGNKLTVKDALDVPGPIRLITFCTTDSPLNSSLSYSSFTNHTFSSILEIMESVIISLVP